MDRRMLAAGSLLSVITWLTLVQPASAAPGVPQPGPDKGEASAHGMTVEELAKFELDEQKIPVDDDAMNRQFHRLQALGETLSDGAGGTYFDPATGQLVVRILNNASGRSLKARAQAEERRPGDVPIRFESTDVSMKRLQTARKLLNDSRDWAGPHAKLVHQVWLDELKAQLVIEASGASDELIAAAVVATGLTPSVNISTEGFSETSRRDDNAPS